MTHNAAEMLGFFVLFFACLGGLIAVLYWLEVSLDQPRQTPSALRRLWSAGAAGARARLQPHSLSPMAGQVARIAVPPSSTPEESQAA